MQGRDMTGGAMVRQLVFFAIPLMLGNLLQQMYNAFDAIVVGNFVSDSALAAVGSSGPLINMIVSFFMGMSSGASVLISQYYGARNIKELQNTVHTAILLSILLGAALSAIGVACSPALLRWMRTPQEVFLDAVAYLRIYFAGLTGLTVYNMGAAVLTATGDSKHPLYFLIFTTVLHIALNLLLVMAFRMGITGVAWSTVISQMICAGLVVALLCRSDTGIRLNLKLLRIHRHILSRVMRIGLPGGIQGAIISCSNVLVYSYVNRLGALVAAGYSAGTRIDGFGMLLPQSIAIAVTTFVGQNLGAGQVKRARDGVRVSLLLGVACTAAVSAAFLALGPHMLRLFSPNEQVLAYGMQFVRVSVPSYFILCFTLILPGALRGAGNVKAPTFICVTSYVVLRQIYLYFATQISGSVMVVALGYPLTWLIAAIALFVYYLKSNWSEFEPAKQTTAQPADDGSAGIRA